MTTKGKGKGKGKGNGNGNGKNKGKNKQPQIPFGDDNQRGKGKGNGNGNGKGKGNSKGNSKGKKRASIAGRPRRGGHAANWMGCLATGRGRVGRPWPWREMGQNRGLRGLRACPRGGGGGRVRRPGAWSTGRG